MGCGCKEKRSITTNTEDSNSDTTNNKSIIVQVIKRVFGK